MTLQKAIPVALLIIVIATNSWAQTSDADNYPTPVGNWLTEDGSAIVSIGACEEGGTKLCGVISSLPNAQNDADVQAIIDQLCGLPVLWDLEPRGRKWTNGKILEVETEQIYDAQLSLKNGDLVVRAYEGTPVFGENMIWTRVPVFVPCKDEENF